MNDWTSWLLWADRDKFRALGENFRGENARLDAHDVLLGLAVLTGVVVALWLLSQYVARREHARRTYSLRGLFNELCRAHNLDRAASKALWRLAQQEQLEHPARLFLEPERFDRESPLVAENREAYRKLQRQIFGEPAG